MLLFDSQQYWVWYNSQNKIKLILELIISLSRALQKLLEYFNGTIILAVFVPSSSVEPVIFCLSLIEALLSGK